MRWSENFRKVTVPVHGLFLLSMITISWEDVRSYFFFYPLLWFLISGLGVAIGYHRLLSHRAFETTPFCKRVLAFLGMLAGQGSPAFWVATHRGRHHPYSDTEKDPHSPCAGLWHAFMGWQIRFSDADFSLRDCLDILRDPWLKFMSQHYYKIYWTFFAMVAIVDWRLYLYGVVPMLVWAAHQENIVNTLCHLDSFGYRSFETGDHSRNSIVLGFLCWGQGFHNNHHRFPRDYDYSRRWYEIDLCRYIVPFLKVRKPRPLREAAPQLIE